MTVQLSPPEGHRPGGQRLSAEAPPAQKAVGRPKGEASTMVHVRLPLTLVAQLDRSLDHLETQTGLKANRGMRIRRAVGLFVAAHAAQDTPGSEG
jgi:hypothetical protein